MKYKLFKLQFSTAVHFGAGGLTTTSDTLMADTVFSALCTEAVKADRDPSDFITAVKEGRIRISDALPYIGDRFYIPKPLAEIMSDKEGDSSIKKALKRLPYIPVDRLGEYMKGTLDIIEESDIFQNCLGQEYLIEKAAVESPMPGSVARYQRDMEGLQPYRSCRVKSLRRDWKARTGSSLFHCRSAFQTKRK